MVDASILMTTKERIQASGRKGSRQFQDPNKVFVGNLPPSCTKKDHMLGFVLETMGQPRFIVHHYNLVCDWRTKVSKGYGFIVFVEPIYASSCIESVHGKKFDGRELIVRVAQKPVKKKRR